MEEGLGFRKSYSLIVSVALSLRSYEELHRRLTALLSVAGPRCTLSCSFRCDSPEIGMSWYVGVTEFLSRAGFTPLTRFDEQTLGFGDESEIVTWAGRKGA